MKFLRTLLASTLGVFFALFIIFMILVIMVASSQRESEPYVRDGSVLHIELMGSIAERTSDDPFAELFDSGLKPVSLWALRSNLRKAAADDRIEGIWLDLSSVSTSWARLYDLHDALEEFKESGKFIYATTNDIGFNQQSYYIATTADSIFAPPLTFFEFEGIALQGQFIKGLLDKIGVEMQVINTGDHKSAGDAFTRTGFSESDREQLQPIVNQFADQFLNAVSESRNISRSELDDFLNQGPQFSIEFSKDFNLIDGFAYPADVKSKIEQRVKDAGHNRLHLVSNDRYSRVKPESAGLGKTDDKNKVAVLYLDGPIQPLSSSSFPGQEEAVITATAFNKNFEALLEDDDIKAIVLYVNSPGGAASTSELIWAEIKNREREIPVITYMGPVAASGGYYIGMAGDKVMSSPTTITGSIGVIATIPNASELLNDKLGITFDSIKSHEHAGWLNLADELSPAEVETISNFSSQTYDTFVSRVASSRDQLDVDDILPLAGGRIYSGTDAVSNSLIDSTGTLRNAINWAAELAQLDENFSINTYPRPKTFFEQITSSSSGASLRTMIRKEMPMAEEVHWIQNVVHGESMQNLLIMPFDLKIE